MAEETWTIGRLLTWTTDFLREKGADNPRLDAEVLLAHVRGCQRIELYTAFEEAAPQELRQRFRALVKERAAGKPVAYLVGHREFFSLKFEVTPDVLIPRPESESLIVRALDLAKQPPLNSRTEPLEIADVGTGSGILAVTLAKRQSTCRVTAVDISPQALAVAHRNAEKHAVSDRVTFVESDLLAAIPANKSFDVIVSNPPYVKSGELEQLATDIRRYEPALALDGGPQGTTIIERLIPQASARLRAGGWLLIEIGPSTVARVEQLLDAAPGLARKQTLKDVAGLPRVVQAQAEVAR